jgi:hypothetical protein
MGYYCGPMGYGMQFPANQVQVGRRLELWDIRGYGLSELWFMRATTVIVCFVGNFPNSPWASSGSEIKHVGTVACAIP